MRFSMRVSEPGQVVSVHLVLMFLLKRSFVMFYTLYFPGYLYECEIKTVTAPLMLEINAEQDITEH